MIRLCKIYIILCLLLACSSCAREELQSYVEEDVEVVENPMLFGVEQIAQTKVTYDGVTASFEVGDEIGIYAFYNNFYYYYNDYGVFAESVLFANHGAHIGDSSNAIYEPLRSWTFSTVYGTAPHTLDCVAYYPLKEGYNPDHVIMNYDDTDAVTLQYCYYYDYETEDEDASTTGQIVRDTVDFMTAHTRYDEYQGDPETFRTEMLGLTSIPLEFTRQTASLNFQVTKPDDHTNTIIVTGLTIYFDACTKFTQSISGSDTISWSDMTENHYLEATRTCSKALVTTNWDAIPEEGSSNTVANLLDDDNMLFFPPKTEIWKVVFTITDNGEEKEYTWHPHVAEIVANTHYTLSLELDPDRAN